MVKKSLLVFALAALAAGGAFAQDEEEEVVHKHKAGDMLLGLNWGFFGAMMNTNPMDGFSKIGDSVNFDTTESGGRYSVDATIDLPVFFTTVRLLNLGLSYEYYVFHWMSVGTGLGFGPEINFATKGGKHKITVNSGTKDDAEKETMKQVLKVVHLQAGLFLTIPFNVHFNIPKLEWLYGGLGLEIHIPVSDAGLDSLLGAEALKHLSATGSIKGETFVSMPIDIGFDFFRVKENGKEAKSRLFLRIEPEFFGEGLVSVPISLIWQSTFWKLANVPIPGTK
ncbi:MAG: hypothetical protein LBC77_07630 [Spirochaetaceae bacterium]|jgi:hypothetical protein|nr:hypothetical protein [Spirochaetaceae bacterium]